VAASGGYDPANPYEVIMQDHQQDVREAMGALEREVLHVKGSQAGVAVAASLRTALTRLVGALQLGPAPELAACPHCGVVGMRAATRCSGCWAELTPPAVVEGRA
jgi:hypothetical protein